MKSLYLLTILLPMTHHWIFKGVTLNVDPSSVFEGDNLHLECLYTKIFSIKVVTFYKDNIPITSGVKANSGYRHHIKVHSSNDSGSFHCTADKEESPHVYVTVQELFSTPTLTIGPATEIFEGQRLKLACRVAQKAGNIRLQYSFYRDGKPVNFEPRSIRERLEATSLHVSGTYHCVAKAPKRGVQKSSAGVHISVKEAFSKPMLKVESGAHLLTGQRLKLTCVVQILRPSLSLRYTFSKDSQALSAAPEDSSYILEQARMDDSGVYICEATAVDSKVKKLSNQVLVSVRRIPVSKPELIIQPGTKLIEGDTASITCSVSNGSSPITYTFHKNFNKELHSETTNLARITYGIIKVNKSSEGNYSCSVANDETEPFLQSNVVTVAVIVPVDGAILIWNTNSTEISAGDRFLLRCRVNVGTEPCFHWYFNSQKLEINSELYYLNSDGSELAVNSFQPRHGGRYQCVATNSGINGGIFNASSNLIHVALAAHSNTMAKATTALPLLLISAAIVALAFVKLLKKRRGNAAGVCTSQGEGTGERPGPSREETPTSDFGHPVARSSPSVADTETDADVFYAVVTVTKSTNAGTSGDTSRQNQPKQEGQADNSVIYAALRHGKNEGNWRRDQLDEGDVYENLLRN
ncbi:Fc receptor-like protein 2 [Carcharodon carcharias]|uniref:Fc receptor-like protein 2 n=1 Tax=Carcharodon carcharias TaxID=13397 RepID=UPI001B7E13F1|nr:Fc receptor-like protein 2 [Carcharodon carcharias]